MRNLHGIISIILAFSAFGLGAIQISFSSVLTSVVYLLIIFIFVLITAKNYCAKCNSREYCNHYIFGKISVFLTEPDSSEYKMSDYLSVGVTLISVILFPQFWLFENPVLLLIFWFLLIVAGLEIYFYVCNRCINKKCAICGKLKEI